MHDTEGIHRIEIPGEWLDGDELFVCAVQPDPPSPDAPDMFEADASRPGALALAEELLEQRIRHWPVTRPALIVFPELAFGSVDFAALDDWVGRLRSPTIVLAGFGFCSGSRLQSLLVDHGGPLEPAWPGDLDPDGTYNAGWCWIFRPGEQLRRLVFLKNFAEQKVEIALAPGWTPGSHILRLDTDDLTIFPLICADLICDRQKSGVYPGSPRHRIRAALDADHRPHRRFLVAGLLYSEKTYSDYWKTSLNDLIAAADDNSRPAVFLVNLGQPAPCEEELQDCWRSLTGAFLHRGQVAGAPRLPLPHVRYLETNSARGLVLRLTRPGAAEGALRWRCGADQGAAVWNPAQRRLWNRPALDKAGGPVTGSELSRFLARKKRRALEGCHECLRPLLSARLERLERRLGHHLDPSASGGRRAKWISNLWPRLLYGLNKADQEQSNPDNLYPNEQILLRALTILAALNAPGLAPLILEATAEAQLLMAFEPKFLVMVWYDPALPSRRQIRNLQHLVDDSGRPGLLVIGAGARGYEVAQKIKPNRRGNITRPAPTPMHHPTTSDRDAREHRVRGPRSLRPVYWLPLGELENVLENENWDPEAAKQLDRRLKDQLGNLLRQAGGSPRLPPLGGTA